MVRAFAGHHITLQERLRPGRDVVVILAPPDDTKPLGLDEVTLWENEGALKEFTQATSLWDAGSSRR